MCPVNVIIASSGIPYKFGMKFRLPVSGLQ